MCVCVCVCGLEWQLLTFSLLRYKRETFPKPKTLKWFVIWNVVLLNVVLCFTPAGGNLQLTELQLLNYDAVVTEDALRPLSRLRSLSIVHLYSVPGPTCHLQTWLTSLPRLCSLSVHGGHPLSAYANFLPASLHSLSLCVDLEPEDLYVVSTRVPHLQHLHLEPWSSASNLVRLLPQLFPQLLTLRIRHRHVSDQDFLHLQQLHCLHTLEILDSYYKPNPKDPTWTIYQPSPHLVQLISDLQRQTNHRVQVITSSVRNPIACHCIWPISAWPEKMCDVTKWLLSIQSPAAPSMKSL